MLSAKLHKLARFLTEEWEPQHPESELARDVIVSFLEELGDLIYYDKISDIIVLEVFYWDILLALHFVPVSLRNSEEYKNLVKYLLVLDETLDEEQLIPDENGKVERNVFDSLGYEVEDLVQKLAYSLYRIGIAIKKYNDNLMSDLKYLE